MKSNKIRIMIKKVNEFPKVIEVENDLSVLQKIVGGYIEVVKMANGLDLVVNDSGLIDELPINFTLKSHGILNVHGDCFFTGVNYHTGEFVDLTNEHEKNLFDMFVVLDMLQ